MKRPALICALLGLFACKVERVDEAASAKPSAKPSERAEPEPEPVEPADAPAPTGEVDLQALLEGDTPTMPASIAAFRANQTRAEVRELAPGMRVTANPRIFELAGANTTWNLRFDDLGEDANVHLISVTTSLPRQAALELATERWGKPKTVTMGPGHTTFFWFNEAARLRASLSPSKVEGELTFEVIPYLSTAELLGEGGLDLTAGAMLGLTRAEVEAKFGARLRRIAEPAKPAWSAHLWYPASTWNPLPSLVRLESDQDGAKVERVELELPFLFLPKLRAEVFAELVALYGEPASGDAESAGRFEVGEIVIDTTLERGRWLLSAHARH